MDKNWIDIKVENSPATLDEYSYLIFALNCVGITEHENHYNVCFDPDIWTDEKKSAFVEILKSKGIPKSKISFNIIPHENWNENWKENFKIFSVGKSIVVQPDWEKYQPKDNECLLTIAPKMAFGTGHHETTQLILRLMEGKIKKGMSVIDAGTGSGILAIYASLNGADPIIAFDNDPEAIENANENCGLNNVKNIDVRCCVLNDIKPSPTDLIIANINRNILLDLAPSFADYAHNETSLILSGLLDIDRPEIEETYLKNGWKLQESKQMGEWMALRFNRIKNP